MTLTSTQRLLEIMRLLRDPERGCPWDRQQTFASIVPHTLEEAYELAESIEQGDADAIHDELGDLLFQVVFYAQLGSERGWFDFETVAERLCRKLERRHPHVFQSQEVRDIRGQWERIKAAERREAAGDREPGTLTGVAGNLPALSRAQKLQKRAARAGFDWHDPQPVLAKIEEELVELGHELGQENNGSRVEEELGDLLFACVNLARHAGIDAESALRRANRKFETRFAFVEKRLAEHGCRPEDSTLEEMDALWDEAKRREQQIGNG